MQLAGMSLYYLLAMRYLHGWAPATVAYSNLFTTRAPYIYALYTGVNASLTEEFLFRVLAISLLKRVLKYDWLAVLIPALLWGIMHINDPNQPFLVRTLEISLWGIILGYVFLRYGPLPVLIAHGGYDAFLGGMIFLRSKSWLLRWNFVVVLLLVLLPLGLSYWWGRRKQAEQETEPRFDNEALQQQLEQRSQRAPLPEAEPGELPSPIDNELSTP